jgi:hypothetical protein
VERKSRDPKWYTIVSLRIQWYKWHRICVSEMTTAYLVSKLSGRFTAGSEGANSPTAVATEFVSDCVLPCFVNGTKYSDCLYLNYILCRCGQQHKDSALIT